MDIKEFRDRISEEYNHNSLTMLFLSLISISGMVACLMRDGLETNMFYIGKPLKGNVDCPSDSDVYFTEKNAWLKFHIIDRLCSLLGVIFALLNKLGVPSDELIGRDNTD